MHWLKMTYHQPDSILIYFFSLVVKEIYSEALKETNKIEKRYLILPLLAVLNILRGIEHPIYL